MSPVLGVEPKKNTPKLGKRFLARERCARGLSCRKCFIKKAGDFSFPKINGFSFIF